MGICYSKIDSLSIANFIVETKTLSPRTGMKKLEDDICFRGFFPRGFIQGWKLHIAKLFQILTFTWIPGDEK